MVTENQLTVNEGLTAVWCFHLRVDQAENAWCGNQIFHKDLPLRLWGFTGHVGERYCSRCEALAAEHDITLPKHRTPQASTPI